MAFIIVSDPDICQRGPQETSVPAQMFSHLLKHILTAAVGDTCSVPRKRGVKYPLTFLDSWLRLLCLMNPSFFFFFKGRLCSELKVNLNRYFSQLPQIKMWHICSRVNGDIKPVSVYFFCILFYAKKYDTHILFLLFVYKAFTFHIF